MSNLSKAVGEFIAERDNFITAIKNCPASNLDDYWRWQGNAEARRVLRETLERAGIDLTAELAPVADPERLAKAIEQGASDVDLAKYFLPGATDGFVAAILAANVFRDESTVKAEALREAATAARAEAANSRTPQGHAEATTYADWLDDRATEIDPARLEGAHP